MFKKDFVWGVATASVQIEGGAKSDGKGPSIWDTFCDRGGVIEGNETPAVSCDHYHRWAEDVEIMAELGIRAYRMSVSWPRLFPEGTGKINRAGVDFYNRLFDRCLEKGIEPYVTLYHWDLPQKLSEKGGWLNRDCADWFAEYSAKAAELFSDRVKQFIPLNEPTCALVLGYAIGVHAPGYRLSRKEANAAAHHMLLAQGKSVQALRAGAKSKLCIGTATVANVRTPSDGTKESLEAARAATFAPEKWAENAAWWLDPILLDDYVQQKLPGYEDYFENVREGDLAIISSPIDYIGLNMYNSFPVSARAVGSGTGGIYCNEAFKPGDPKTSMGWPVTPEVMYYGPKFYSERYKGVPIYITENGVALNEWICSDGKVHDPMRADYLKRYLRALADIADEADVRGYFYWSLLDNFEWSNGYDKRFGLVYVDYGDCTRTIKDSAWYYKEIIASDGEILSKV